MKSKLIRSTLILTIGGIITKLLAFIIKIYFTRNIKDGINIYALVMPTYSLLITITQLGFPVAISNIISKGKKRGINIISSLIPVSLILNIILISFIFLVSKFISIILLHSSDTYYPLLALSLVLPFISIASILRGYFFGKQQMYPHVISNVIEQLFKLFVVIIVLPKILKYGYVIAVSGYILISIVSETISIIVFLLFLPRNVKINKEDLKPDLSTIRDVLSIGVPSSISRIIGNIGYFFEPIILSTFLLRNGYSSLYITSSYAVYNTYVIGILVVPTFLMQALAQSLLPELSKNVNDRDTTRRIFNKVIKLTLIYSFISNILIYFLANDILDIVFNTSKGIDEIKFLSIFFSLYYLEYPFITLLEAHNKMKYILMVTVIGIIIKLSLMALLCYFNIGIYSLIISEIVNIIFTDIMYYLKIKNLLQI